MVAELAEREPAVDVDAYLQRIGLADRPSCDRAGLLLLHRAHLAFVPFENLDVVAGVRVRTDLEWSLDKIVNRRRGGWCFEMNGAFGALLRALGFEVIQLGAAVLLSGPTKIIDHLALEVRVDDEVYLVDVGFGESFAEPLLMNVRRPQVDPAGTFELIDSSDGLTMTRHDELGIPVAQYRFRRMHHELSDFDSASEKLRTDPTFDWSQKPFATRLADSAVGSSPVRMTLKKDRLTYHGVGEERTEAVPAETWNDVLLEHFDVASPLQPNSIG